MTKKELVEEIARIYNMAADLRADYRDLNDRLKEIETALEELPLEEADITDEKETE